MYNNFIALVVELVDTKDLKSLPFGECRFESGRGHHYMSKFRLLPAFSEINFNLKSAFFPIRSFTNLLVALIFALFFGRLIFIKLVPSARLELALPKGQGF